MPGSAARRRFDLGTGVVLVYCDLSNGNLRGVDLSSADLQFTDLSVADLSSADLSGADLTRAILTNADLTGAGPDQREVVQHHLPRRVEQRQPRQHLRRVRDLKAAPPARTDRHPTGRQAPGTCTRSGRSSLIPRPHGSRPLGSTHPRAGSPSRRAIARCVMAPSTRAPIPITNHTFEASNALALSL